jgi:hypothetical protein
MKDPKEEVTEGAQAELSVTNNIEASEPPQREPRVFDEGIELNIEATQEG